MAENYNDSNLSRGDRGEMPAGPVRQHHRMATGEKVTGQTNPFGAAAGPTEKKVGNAPETY